MATSFDEYFNDYADAFNRFDAERIAAFYHCPCLMVSTVSAALLPNFDAIRANAEALIALHRAQDFGRAMVEGIAVQQVGTNLAIVEVTWRVERTDGSLLWSFRNTYNLGDFGAGWKVLVSTTHGS